MADKHFCILYYGKEIHQIGKETVKEKPLHMAFEDIIKLAVNTPIKNSKINKK